jgi:hypothetical protein
MSTVAFKPSGLVNQTDGRDEEGILEDLPHLDSVLYLLLASALSTGQLSPRPPLFLVSGRVCRRTHHLIWL